MAEQKLLVKREGDFHYPIYFKNDFQDLAGAIREEGLENRKICIVTDSHVAPLYYEAVKSALQEISSEIFSFVFEAGEKNKNLNTVQELYKTLIENEMDRKGLLVALGGGVVGDLTGFGASTYLRGIDFIQVPTTLLAQVDSSVGGKTGVDFLQYKNMVGAFHQPRLVYMNMSTLQSLPNREFTCGMGEILKTGLICDEEFFRFVCKNQSEISKLDLSMLSRMIRRCCEIKAGVVERDPKEQGERALLNLGHTVGHAVEKMKNFQLLHGQCVGVGLIAAAYLSMQRGLLTEEEYEEIIAVWKSDNAGQALQKFVLRITGCIIILLLTILDQGSKSLVLAQLKDQPDISLIPGVLQLRYLENRGMAFGLFEGKIPVFVILCLLFFGVFIYVYARIPKNRYYLPLSVTALVMVSGALGNFIDRVCRGYVVDFIYFSLIDFPVFNIADMYVVCSGILLVMLVCFRYKNDEDYDFLRIKKD